MTILSDWETSLTKQRNLCNSRHLAYKKVKSRKEFDELLFTCKNLQVKYVPVASMLSTDDYKDSTDSLLIVKL